MRIRIRGDKVRIRIRSDKVREKKRRRNVTGDRLVDDG